MKSERCKRIFYQYSYMANSNSSKTFKKNRKKLKYIFMIILELAEPFKTMNLPDPTVTLLDGLFLGKYQR